jgi:parvulin-like peptidyl-prolyl isomerase
MRVYYQQHVGKPPFSEPSEVVFDVIKIDPANLHSQTAEEDRQLAFEQAKQAHDRAASGTSFATLFQEYNNDPGLSALTSGTGNMGTMERGTFNVKEVDDAVWKLQPGQVTDVIQADGVLYVARMESRKEGVVRPFEDEDVQKLISMSIRRERSAPLYAEEENKLLSEAVVETKPEMVDTAAEMAMQSYRIWNGK